MNALTCINFKREVARSSVSDVVNCLVLESDPVPDYYAKGNFPPNKRDREMHLYLLIKNQILCFQDVVLRETCCINEKYNKNLHVFPGQMTYQNDYRYILRIGASDADAIPVIVKEMNEKGFEFVKDTKVNQYESTVFYKKHIDFESMEDGVYKDKNNPFRYFFSVSSHVTLSELTEGIKKIKNNCNFHMFDSFLAYFFYENKMKDFIGIYSEHCDINRFGELKNQIKEIFNQ